MAIRYGSSSDRIDWAALRRTLIDDGFDNGRTPAQLERSFRASFARVYARDGALIVGTARALSDGVCNAYIVDMWTLSTHRRRGIGRRMLERLCDVLPGQHVYLFTDEAHEFYAACGFKPRGQGLERVVGEWLHNATRGG